MSESTGKTSWFWHFWVAVVANPALLEMFLLEELVIAAGAGCLYCWLGRVQTVEFQMERLFHITLFSLGSMV